MTAGLEKIISPGVSAARMVATMSVTMTEEHPSPPPPPLPPLVE